LFKKAAVSPLRGCAVLGAGVQGYADVVDRGCGDGEAVGEDGKIIKKSMVAAIH
jgi:hypothetical protein